MSNLLKRVLIGIIGIPFIILACYLGGLVFLLFSIIVASLALWELLKLFENKKIFPLKTLGVLLSAALLILYFIFNYEVLILLFIAIAIVISTEILRVDKINPLNAVIVIFGFLYITIPFVMMNEMLKINSINTVIYIFVLIWTCDTAAYFAGRFFGKRKLSAVSPKKTWEGAIAGFLFTLIISVLIHFIYSDKLSLKDSLAVGVIIGIFSQVGDLFESSIKRFCGVKDSSNIIPGHGGMLDRFDSLIFVTPLVYIYFFSLK